MFFLLHSLVFFLFFFLFLQFKKMYSSNYLTAIAESIVLPDMKSRGSRHSKSYKIRLHTIRYFAGILENMSLSPYGVQLFLMMNNLFQSVVDMINRSTLPDQGKTCPTESLLPSDILKPLFYFMKNCVSVGRQWTLIDPYSRESLSHALPFVDEIVSTQVPDLSRSSSSEPDAEEEKQGLALLHSDQYDFPHYAPLSDSEGQSPSSAASSISAPSPVCDSFSGSSMSPLAYEACEKNLKTLPHTQQNPPLTRPSNNPVAVLLLSANAYPLIHLYLKAGSAHIRALARIIADALAHEIGRLFGLTSEYSRAARHNPELSQKPLEAVPQPFPSAQHPLFEKTPPNPLFQDDYSPQTAVPKPLPSQS